MPCTFFIGQIKRAEKLLRVNIGASCTELLTYLCKGICDFVTCVIIVWEGQKLKLETFSEIEDEYEGEVMIQ